ncbi:MAG: 50S ribosomal protein L9 [Gammaproteobacteria bacterium]|nr:50S ribosomal protein L9 [Gammaproteobacteria bacterium]
MELILLEKIANLGDIGDVVKVKSGFGRNFLLPKGKATVANEANRAKFEAIRAELEQKAKLELDQAQTREQTIRTQTLTIAAKVAEEDKLYGSVGTFEIVEAFGALGVEVERSEVQLPDGPMRTLGEHTANIALHADLVVPVAINVIAEEA